MSEPTHQVEFQSFFITLAGQYACRLLDISQVVLFQLLRYPQVSEKKSEAFQNAMYADCEDCKVKWKLYLFVDGFRML